jgi:hypothetical protein
MASRSDVLDTVALCQIVQPTGTVVNERLPVQVHLTATSDVTHGGDMASPHGVWLVTTKQSATKAKTNRTSQTSALRIFARKDGGWQSQTCSRALIGTTSYHDKHSRVIFKKDSTALVVKITFT